MPSNNQVYDEEPFSSDDTEFVKYKMKNEYQALLSNDSGSDDEFIIPPAHIKAAKEQKYFFHSSDDMEGEEEEEEEEVESENILMSPEVSLSDLYAEPEDLHLLSFAPDSSPEILPLRCQPTDPYNEYNYYVVDPNTGLVAVPKNLGDDDDQCLTNLHIQCHGTAIPSRVLLREMLCMFVDTMGMIPKEMDRPLPLLRMRHDDSFSASTLPTLSNVISVRVKHLFSRRLYIGPIPVCERQEITNPVIREAIEKDRNVLLVAVALPNNHTPLIYLASKHVGAYLCIATPYRAAMICTYEKIPYLERIERNLCSSYVYTELLNQKYYSDEANRLVILNNKK